VTTPAPVRAQHLAVNETFLSFQGEGPSTGERAVFLRLAGCNLACTWCDTAYSWDWNRHDRQTNSRSEDALRTAADIAALARPQCRLLVLTGGEPLLQQRAAATTVAALRELRPDMRCEVETNGTVAPTQDLSRLVHRFVVSPKLAHSGVPETDRINPDALRAFAGHDQSVLKFVVSQRDDLREAAAVADATGFAAHRVWIMPLGEQAEVTLDTSRAIADDVLAAGFNLTLRLHVLLWNGAPGR
jgi:7-carboxy-7-deazaguanine synthase